MRTFVSGLIRAHRKQLGSVWRKQFAVSTTTCWRYVNEVVELLAQRSSKLREMLWKARRQDIACVVIDGTLIPIDRIAAARPFYSGKHKTHG